MKRLPLKWLLACGLYLHVLIAAAAAAQFSFGVIAHPSTLDEAALREVIDEVDEDKLAFVVANGIKATDESCSDKVYNRRKTVLDSARSGVIVALAGSDWVECRNDAGKSAAIGRLNRLRDLFFPDEFSMGANRIPLVRQSMIARFRTYGENARWEMNGIMFATLNLPADNNHYLLEAGRNNEFEDRLIANRDWLQRVFKYATRKKLRGIVLFSDANPLARPSQTTVRRDGFLETRQLIAQLASRYPGKVLIVHGRPAASTDASARIVWRGNLGVLQAGSPWSKVSVDLSTPSLFRVSADPAGMKTNTRPTQ